MRPKRFKAYEFGLDRDGGIELMHQGAWLASTLLWWPLGFLTIWVIMREIGEGGSLGMMLSLLSLIIFSWLLTGMRGTTEEGWELFVMPILTFIISVSISVVLSSRIADGTISVMGLVIAIVLGTGISFVIAMTIVEGLAILVTSIAPFTIAMSSVFLLQIMGNGSEGTALLPGLALFGSYFLASRLGQRISGRWIPEES